MKIQDTIKILAYASLLCLGLFFVAGCTQQTGTPPSKAPTAKAPTAPKEAGDVIPLDNSKGEASLTKNFYIIFDGSGSMNDRPCGKDRKFDTKLDATKWAIAEFLKKVPGDVNLGLYVFDAAGAREVVKLGPKNRQEFSVAIMKAESGGATPLAKAINYGTDRLVEQYKRQLGYGEYRLIVVTDGQADGIPKAVARTQHLTFPIYTIGICIGNDHALYKLSHSYRAADNPAEIAKALEETVAELPTFDAGKFEKLN